MDLLVLLARECASWSLLALADWAAILGINCCEIPAWHGLVTGIVFQVVISKNTTVGTVQVCIALGKIQALECSRASCESNESILQSCAVCCEEAGKEGTGYIPSWIPTGWEHSTLLCNWFPFNFFVSQTSQYRIFICNYVNLYICLLFRVFEQFLIAKLYLKRDGLERI